MIASSPSNLQNLLAIVEAYTKQWRFLLSAGKCSVRYYLSKTRPTCDIQFVLGNRCVKNKTSTNRLGIIQDRSLKSAKHTHASIQKVKNTFHAMVGLGLKPLVCIPRALFNLFYMVARSGMICQTVTSWKYIVFNVILSNVYRVYQHGHEQIFVNQCLAYTT